MGLRRIDGGEVTYSRKSLRTFGDSQSPFASHEFYVDVSNSPERPNARRESMTSRAPDSEPVGDQTCHDE